MTNNLDNFTDFLDSEIYNSQPISLPSSYSTDPGPQELINVHNISNSTRPVKGTGERGGLRCVQEIDPKYRGVFTYQYFNLVQSRVIEDALYSDKSLVVCAPTGSGKTVIFEMAIVQLLMEMDDKQCDEDFKIIYMAPIKALCTERLTEWYPKFTKLNLLCIEVTGDTDVDFSQLKPYRIIITTPEKWDMLTRRWRDNRGMVEVIKLFLIDEVHILNDGVRGPVLEAVVSRMKTIQASVQSTHRIEQLQRQGNSVEHETAVPKIRFVAVSATISNPEDVAEWLGTSNKPAVFYKFGDECRPVKLRRVVEGYPCPEGTSIFKFDIILNYKLWAIIQKYHNGKPTLIFCNTRKSVLLTAETLSREITINFKVEQRAKLVTLASLIKNKKVQSLVLCGVGCHHAGLLFEERTCIEQAFRNSDLPILITTTTLAMGVNLPAHLVIIKNTQQYVNGAYQEYSISTILQMVGRAGRPQFDTEATAVIMTRLTDKARYQALVGGCEPLQSYLHKRLAENLNSEAALGTVNDVAQCVQWLRSTFLFVRAARDPRKYLGLPPTAPSHHISKKIEELCVKAMNGLASAGLITMDEASCIESTEAGRLMSIYYLDLETMKHIMKIKGNESLEQLLWIVCESHELSDMHLRVDERRCLNALNRSNSAATIRFPMKGKINTRQMKLNCIIQAVLGCLPIHEPSLNQEAMKIMRIADRICKCLVAYVTRQNMLRENPQCYQSVLNVVLLTKCIESHLWENSSYVSKQLKGIGPTFSTLLATAGKINFMLLEESHPRDLERIMNKGPPAGNIIRKQISLLPKYQITMIPVDQRSVKIQLVLLNQMHLAENVEHLTAGANHKCYIIIGDTENYLLLFTSFKDKDLISVFDGQITHEIVRRHNFEHRIFAHCISANYAGIDVQCDYLFKDLGTTYHKDTKAISCENTTTKTRHIKQAEITDTFKLRKRKQCDHDLTCPKEKKKRDYPVIEKIKSLGQSFDEKKGKVVELNASCECDPSHMLIENVQTYIATKDRDDFNKTEDNINIKTVAVQNFPQNHEKIYEESYEDDEQINIILNEIEKEIRKPEVSEAIFNKEVRPHCKDANTTKNIGKQQYNNKINDNKHIEYKKKSRNMEKSNFTIIDTIEERAIDDHDEVHILNNNNNTFADTVKSHIDKFLEKIQQTAKQAEKNVTSLLEIKQIENLPQRSKNLSNNNIDILINQKESISDNDLTCVVNKEDRDNWDKVTQSQDSDVIERHQFKVVEPELQQQELSIKCDGELKKSNCGNELALTEKNIINLDKRKNTEKCTQDNRDLSIRDIDISYNHKKFKSDPDDIESRNSDAYYNNGESHLQDNYIIKYNQYKLLKSDLKQKEQIINCDRNLENSNSDNILTKLNVAEAYGFDLLGKKQSNNLIKGDSGFGVNNHNIVSNNNKKIILDKDEEKVNNKVSTPYEMCITDINQELEILQRQTKISDGKLKDSKTENSLMTSNTKQTLTLNNMEAYSTTYHLKTLLDIDPTLVRNSRSKINPIESKLHKPYINNIPSIGISNEPKNLLPSSHVTTIANAVNDKDLSLRINTVQNIEIQNNEVTSKELSNRDNDFQPVIHNCAECPMSEASGYTKIYSLTKTQLNIYSNSNREGNYCVINKLNIDVNVTETNCNVQRNKATSDIKNVLGIQNDIEDPSKQSLISKNDNPEAPIETSNVNIMQNNVEGRTYTQDETFKKEDDNICQKEENERSVKDIILKYKNLISSKVNGNPQLHADHRMLNTDSGNSIIKQSEKIKRPYKITDIPKLEKSINQSQNSQTYLHPTYSKFEDRKPNFTQPNYIEINKYQDKQKEMLTNPEIVPCSILDSNSPEPQLSVSNIESPRLDQAELLNDEYDMSQTMFNPKALLECLKQDDVIPPPSQFRDNNTLVSPDRNFTSPDRFNALSQNALEEDNINILNDLDNNVFEENQDEVLTPTKEIETWTLSREDELNSNPYKSFTFVRSNNAKNFYQQANSNRKSKLNEFKFSRKHIYNPRK